MAMYAAEPGLHDFEDSHMQPAALRPPGKTVVDSYHTDVVNGFQKDAPRYNPMNPDRLQTSAQVDLKDPIQVHLLTETALTDSKEYEIMSQEEVDELKKQIQLFTQRIESTRANLLIQAKYRDAAVSMAKLYSPTTEAARADGDAERALEAEAEREECERNCEKLATELFNLEKRIMEPQRRLLEHTAGVLQLTHKVTKKKAQLPPGAPANGMPGSPESLYTYTRNSLDQAADGYYEDGTNMYSFDPLDGIQTKGNPIEIPIKSPVREQNAQLREEVDRVREENTHLLQSIADMETRLDHLNGSLRDAIVRFDPAKNHDYSDVPYASERDLEPGHMLKSHMQYLEAGIGAIHAEHDASGGGGGAQLAQRIEMLNQQMHDLLTTVDPEYPAAPAEFGLEQQLEYLEDAVRAADSELERAVEAAGSGKPAEPVGDTETALIKLWDMIQSGLAGIQQQRDERRRARQEKGLEDDDISEDEEFTPGEAYTLNAFSSRVQWLYMQATTLKSQKSVLKRQIKQQRELNNKSDAEKDEELHQKQEEIEQGRRLLERAEMDATDAQKMLSEALEDLEQAREAAGSAGEAHAEIEERNHRIASLEAELDRLHESFNSMDSGSKETEDRLHNLDATVTALGAELDEVQRSKEAAEEASEKLKEELEEKTKTLKTQEENLELLNASLAEIKTELTIAQAELDGAYGTRAERAADIAAIKTSAEVTSLHNQIDKLKVELSATVQELEDITKETLGAEKEKNQLEGRLDEARTIRVALEGDVTSLRERMETEENRAREQISQLKEDLDAERLKAVGASGRPGAGAAVLSEQFRTTMREERKKFQEDLREERSRNRKLEEELAKVKRAQGPGKSPLSPR